jgi:conjugative transfer region protein TrbK
MRNRSFKITAMARAAAYVTVAASIAAAAVHFSHNEKSEATILLRSSAQSDPLASELAHCQSIGTAAQNDAACQAAWAENRRRFFTYRPSDYPEITPPTNHQPAARTEGQ